MFEDIDPALQFLAVIIAVFYLFLLFFVFELAAAIAVMVLIGWFLRSLLFGRVGAKIKEYFKSKKGKWI